MRAQVPQEELALIFDGFQNHDHQLCCQLDRSAFVGFWQEMAEHPKLLVRLCPGHGSRRVTVACVLLNGLPDLSPEEVGELFDASDADHSGMLDVNEVLAALIDAADEAYARSALHAAQHAAGASIAISDFRSHPALVRAYPVAVRLMREFDLDRAGSLGHEEFVRGMRLLIDVASTLRPPLLTTLAKDRTHLLALFASYDLNRDGVIDVNEWLLMLQKLQQSFLSAVSSEGSPHRNKLLRAMRLGKKQIADKCQRELYAKADRGEALPASVDAALLLSDFAAARAQAIHGAASKEAAIARRAKRERKAEMLASQVLAITEQRRHRRGQERTESHGRRSRERGRRAQRRAEAG